MIIYAVDDEKLNLQLLTNVLKKVEPNALVLGFSKPKEALEAAKKDKPDICFLDIQMPVMNGIELASELIKVNNKANIIFATSFDDYRGEAMDLFASGYVLKPVSVEKITTQIEHLRYPVENNYEIYAQTFGAFCLFAKGAPVRFHRSKSKEMLAYIIEKRGKIVSRKELSKVLFQDDDYSRKRQKQIDVICRLLDADLKEANISEILLRGASGFMVETSKFNCDLYDYLDGSNKINYQGEYMEQFAWGKEFKNKH